MNTLESLLAGIVSDPLEETRWLVLADCLEEYDDPRRGELLRLHRRMLATCCEPDQHPERATWQARIVELIAEGVSPCVPQKTVLLPGDVEIRFSFIPPGSFLMGSEDKKARGNEKPIHSVQLTKGFYLGIYAVTQAQWMAVMTADYSEFKGSEDPIEGVSWNDCQEFCKRLSTHLRDVDVIGLPTEAQWEYACRAGTTTRYYTGDTIAALRNVCWFAGNSGGESHPVGQLLANPWNLHDLHGNVWEWCEDYYDQYESASVERDPLQMTVQDCRVARGGWFNGFAKHCRSAYRMWCQPDRHSNAFGFRVCIRLGK
jgi:uncharacterized protein (TIGR02996 family)